MRNIRIIAFNTFAQMMRMKVAVVILILLLALIPFMALQVVGDGTLLGKLQTFSSYGLSLVSMLMCFLTITLSCYALSSDIKNKQIFSVVTKPVARYEIVLGKFFGVVLLDLIFLTIFAIIIYALTVSFPKYSKAPDTQIEQANDEFFNARTGVKPFLDIAKFKKEARDEYFELSKLDQVPKDKTLDEYVREVSAQKMYHAISVATGEVKSWEFTNVRPKTADEFIYLRFKYEVSTPPQDNMIAARWVIGDKRQFDNPSKAQTPIYDSYVRRDAVKTFHEIKISSSVVPEDGIINVDFQNMYYNGTAVIPKDIEILYKSGSFGVNFFKANILIFIRLIFLAAMGVSLTTWLSFPVAIFVSLVIYLTGMVHGFIFEAIDSLSKEIGFFYAFTVKPLLYLMPSFDGNSNPAEKILSARMISWLLILQKIGVMAILKSGGIMAVGTMIFNKREIAKVTV